MPLQTLSEQAIISPLHLLNLLRLINARSASSSFQVAKTPGLDGRVVEFNEKHTTTYKDWWVHRVSVNIREACKLIG
jgi:hypothetical protein